MSEFERSEIIYEEGWRPQKPPVPEKPPAEDPHKAAVSDKTAPTPLLISIQLILCGVAALVLFLLKTMDSPAYHGFMDWYHGEMSRPVISRAFFGGGEDERPASTDEVTVEASTDEFPPR